MKTLRFLGMTLLMVMLAVNFTACSDDEEEQTIIEQANLIGNGNPHGRRFIKWRMAKK